MTVIELLSLATATLTAETVDERAAQGRALAQGVMDRLGESQPCGLEAPKVYPINGDLPVRLPDEWLDYHGQYISIEDADHMARLLLHAADTARAKEGGQ
jgi:hypothetical protein